MTWFCLLLFLFTTLANSDQESLLNRGFEYEQEGKYFEALEVWATAFTELKDPSFAIGREYIRLATAQGMNDYYEKASSIYLWGLTSDLVKYNKAALEEELTMLEPLMERGQFKELEEALKKNSPEIYAMLRGVWNFLDPTPGTPYNERLIEHWERIAYAREHFTRNDDSVYGTDGRGTEYVRYGKPDRKFDGSLIASQSDIDSACSYLNRCGDVMATAVLAMDPTPYYEIWIYDYPNPKMKNNLIFIFGESALNGFGRVSAVDDFIPNQAFTFSNRYDHPTLSGFKVDAGSMSPGMVLQWIYYKKFAGIDGYFGRQVHFMDMNWVNTPTNKPKIGPHQGPVMEQAARMEMNIAQREAPNETSSYAEILPEIEIVAHAYRLLDVENRPYFATFMESTTYQPFIEDLSANDEIMMPDSSYSFDRALKEYELIHGLRILDAKGSPLAQYKTPLALNLGEEGKAPNISVFNIPYAGEESEVVVYAELHNTNPLTSPRDETPFKQSLRGLGKITPKFPEPLTIKKDELLVGDIILGYNMDYEAGNEILFPFEVSHSKEIPEGEALALHLEVYNLQPEENGQGKFRVEYAITKNRSLAWLRGKEKELSLGIEFTTQGSWFAENLEIQTRELEEGEYQLELSISDVNSKRTTKTSLGFKIVK